MEFEWRCKKHNIRNQFNQTGRPMRADFIERFNRVYNEAILDANLFNYIREVRALTEEWIKEYNE
jgi:putative transposase